MVVSHELWIVALSVLVAIQGAYVGLNLALALPGSSGSRRRVLLAGAAATLAVAIWSMHFVAMLAVRAEARIEYLVVPTVMSFLVCVVVVGLAVFLASIAPNSRPVLALSAVVMGTGIVTMHFIGMFALHANVTMHHDPAYVVASFLIGVLASGLAIHFAFAGTVRPPLVAASIALGLAIAGMHYTAMAGMTLHPMTDSVIAEGTALSRDLLAVIVAILAFGTSSAFLLALVPDGAPAKLASGMWSSSAAREPSPAPLADPAQVSPAAPPAPIVTAPRDHAPSVLPVQKEGATHYLPIGRVLAVKAESHYTTVFDGTSTFFCGLSITDVERRLDHSRFVRVHRSHIVAVDRIASLRKSGDRGVAQLDSSPPYSLPVSRRKLPELKAMLHARV